MIWTGNLIRSVYSGKGFLAFFSEGSLEKIQLESSEEIFVNPLNVVGFEKGLQYEYKTYGNPLARVRQEFHMKCSGPGCLLLQTNSFRANTEEIAREAAEDSFFRKILKTIFPWADPWI